MNHLKKQIINKKGSAYLNGLMIVIAMIGVGTIMMTYQDYKVQENLQKETTEITNQYDLSSIVTIDDSINSMNYSNGYKYITKISLGNLGDGYLSEETISKDLSIYSGKINYKNGESIGIRVSIENGEDVTIGSSNENNFPIVFMDYFKEVSLKMYNYRFGKEEK